jgi:adenylate cyclase
MSDHLAAGATGVSFVMRHRRCGDRRSRICHGSALDLANDAQRQALICRGCWDQMHVPIPIRGPFAWPFRLFGITNSKMNPNICTICERAFRQVHQRRHISAMATILFADIRGYTRLSEELDPLALSRVVGTFHDACATSVWMHDGIVNKQMGDGLMAIFNFPIKIANHAEAAVGAALDIQQRTRAALTGAAGGSLGIGVGVHTGQVEIGEFSSIRSDFTAIGGAVNLAARLEAQAANGEILVSSETAAAVPSLASRAPVRTLALKGLANPVAAHVLST